MQQVLFLSTKWTKNMNNVRGKHTQPVSALWYQHTIFMSRLECSTLVSVVITNVDIGFGEFQIVSIITIGSSSNTSSNAIQTNVLLLIILFTKITNSVSDRQPEYFIDPFCLPISVCVKHWTWGLALIWASCSFHHALFKFNFRWIYPVNWSPFNSFFGCNKIHAKVFYCSAVVHFKQVKQNITFKVKPAHIFKELFFVITWHLIFT